MAELNIEFPCTASQTQIQRQERDRQEGEERWEQRQQTVTGRQNDGSQVVQEAEQHRLAEESQRGRDVVRWRWRLQQGDEEELRRQHERRYLQQKEQRHRREERRRQQQEQEREQHPQAEEIRQWLERHRQNREEESGRREELAEHTRQRRQRARRARREVDLLTPERRHQPRQNEPSETMVAQQKEALERLVQAAERSFQENQAASARRDWCNPIPTQRKVDTVQGFLKAFRDENTMEIAACSVCYLQRKPEDLLRADWRTAIPGEIQSEMVGVLGCQECFPEGDGEAVVPICHACRAAFDRCRVPEACMRSTMFIGCEHKYPKELRDLTPLEEKVIALNTAYGFITKFNVKRARGSSAATRPSFMSLYVQLSRAERWKGLYLVREPARGDFIEPKNVLDKDMRDAVLKLERLGDETRKRFEGDHKHEGWFQDWDAMAESAQVDEGTDDQDDSLWYDSGSSEAEL